MKKAYLNKDFKQDFTVLKKQTLLTINGDTIFSGNATRQ